MKHTISLDEYCCETLCGLPDDKAGVLFKAMCGYIMRGDEPELSDVTLRACWGLAKINLKRPTAAGADAADEDNAAAAGKSAAKRFVKPTVEDVRAYCRERGNSVDPESFVNFYESKGWMVGKSPMKNWKSAVHTWENRGDRGPKRKSVAGTEVKLGCGERMDGQGNRFYGSGRPVPLDAPPRPGNDFFWSRETNSWVAGV